ncbi:toll/interleukin-1 receptor domain-containing protein [Foetidibacter luteolus]|uniref:toll/interleukin-1 receptor domain-containing protein n=1 Tax=Foetidibacter luteolus TaxID=2608880 RepID=UPI00129ADE12|nr:toll/interleukin-1 receptor domain-containing protein [Foetidibacter luteolus]
MVIGGVGYCDTEGNLQFHKNLLEGLQIYNGSLLFGVYHPRSKYAEKNDRIKYHFMLSPIPYHLWPKTARLIVRLKQVKDFGQTTGIRVISEYLLKQNISLIYSFSNRSAHRYSTWDVHIAFDEFNLDDFKDDYNTENSCYNKVHHATNKLKTELKQKFDKYLFYDEDDIDLRNAVITRVNTSCHYFYYDTERLLKSGDEIEKKIYRPFTVRYNNGNFIPTERGIINEMIYLLEPEKQDFNLPSICFAESDSHYLNLRVIIIPKHLRHQFFKISVFHERLKRPDTNNPTSRGLLNYVLTELQSIEYKIWKTSTLIFECRTDSYGSGKLSLFVESKVSFKESAANEVREKLITFLSNLNEQDSKPAWLQHIMLESRVELVYPEIINRYFVKNRISLEEKEKQFDLFISYSHVDFAFAKKLRAILREEKVKYFIDDEGSVPGDILSQKIEDGLRNSREFCILLSEESQKSKWVFTEWGAASILKKTIVPILLPGFNRAKHKNIDDRLKVLKYIIWPAADPEEALRKYARQIIERRFKSMLGNDSYNY